MAPITHILKLLVATALLVLPSACSESPAEEPDPATANIDAGVFGGPGRAQPARSPGEAIEHLLQSFHQRDPVLFDASIMLDASDRRVARECFATDAMLNEFLSAVEKAYGPAASQDLRAFTSLDRRNRWPGAAQAMPQFRIVAEDDRAIATLPGPNGFLLHLEKQDGVWRIDFAEHLPPPSDRQAVLNAYRRLRPILLDIRPQLNDPELTPETVWSNFLTALDPPTWMRESASSDVD